MLVFDSVSSRSRNVYTRITTPSNFASASSFSRGGRSLLQGRGEELNTLEAEGQMIQRVMPGLMGLKNNLVLNDEAHHCHRGKPEVDEIADLKGDEKDEAKKNNEAARLWMDLRRRRFLSAVRATPKGRCSRGLCTPPSLAHHPFRSVAGIHRRSPVSALHRDPGP